MNMKTTFCYQIPAYGQLAAVWATAKNHALFQPDFFFRQQKLLRPILCHPSSIPSTSFS